MTRNLVDTIAGEVRAARARNRLQQKDLADEMREAGFKWHPQTVSMVEAGKRELSAIEMLALSIVLDTHITTLYGFSRQELTRAEFDANARANHEPIEDTEA